MIKINKLQIVERPCKKGSALYCMGSINGKRYRGRIPELILLEESSEANSKHNKEVLKLAKDYVVKREYELVHGALGLPSPNRCNETLLHFMEERFSELAEQGKVLCHTKLIEKAIRKVNKGILLREVDDTFCLKVQAYLRTYRKKDGEPLASYTQRKAMGTLSFLLNKAVEKKLIPSNPYKLMPPSDKVKGKPKEREILTKSEIARLAQNPPKCKTEKAQMAYKMFLFGILTGLRWGDIRTLAPKHIFQEDGKYFYKKKLEKSIEVKREVLADCAFELLPQNVADSKPYFEVSYGYAWSVIKKWLKDNGITKDISYHNCRHSFATLLLQENVDISVIQRLLNHKRITTTMIYVKPSMVEVGDKLNATLSFIHNSIKSAVNE